MSLSVSKEAQLIAEWLSEWTNPRGGQVKIMANLRHLWEEVLVATNNNPRVLVCYNGENSRGAFPVAAGMHRVDRQWIVVVIRGHGFKNLMAESGGDREPFYDSVETVRDKIRVMLNISEEFPVDYKSIRPLPSPASGNAANAFLDAYTIEFSTANDIPGVVLENPNGEQE